jgi:hypothetical protein
MNEAFGDVVQWDTIPQFAIDSIQLIPGSNPAFGLMPSAERCPCG